MKTFELALNTIRKCLDSDEFTHALERSSEILTQAIKQGNKIIIIGNGGSAAEAQHFAAELVGRYKTERKAYPAIALTTDTSALTAIANDYGYVDVFSRQLQALGNSGDVLVVMSTSGNSENCSKALDIAKQLEISTISLLGKDGGTIKGRAEAEVIVPSDDTARIQEVHLMVIHDWCEKIDAIQN